MSDNKRIEAGAQAHQEDGTVSALLAIWTEALGKDGISLESDFFELGGNSLAASIVINRVQEHFDIALPLHAILDKPTVASLASYIDDILWIQDDDDAAP